LAVSFGQQRAMAAMHAIEVADGEHRGMSSPAREPAKNLHGVE
jgi:hypothetical protein